MSKFNVHFRKLLFIVAKDIIPLISTVMQPRLKLVALNYFLNK
jgi:hypothetical protein